MTVERASSALARSGEGDEIFFGSREPLKTNMEFQSHPIDKENHLPNFPTSIFGFHANFPGCFWTQFYSKDGLYDLGKSYKLGKKTKISEERKA